MPIEAHSTYHTAYKGSKRERENFETFKSKNVYVRPTEKMEMTTTNNTSYKYWISVANNSNSTNNSNCVTKYPINYQSTYNYCYPEPGTYAKTAKSVSNQEDLCSKCC